MNIVINGSDVSNYGRQLLDFCDELEEQNKKIDTLINEINLIWDGLDALEYIKKMRDECCVFLGKTQKATVDFGNYLAKIPDVYSTLDEVFSSKNIEV